MEANNKALRDALDDTVGLLESILEAFKQGTDGVYMSDVSEAIDKARAALAAPLRNCDLYSTEAKAYRAWERYYNSIDHLKEDYLDYEDWLFCEVKGGANG